MRDERFKILINRFLLMQDQKYVIVGDGIAGATAAETIRDNSEDAKIVVLTDESEPLYNRIMLKTYMKGSLPKQYTRVHDENWYEKRDIDLELETRVTDVDRDREVVKTDGREYSYDRLLVASGGSPCKLAFDQGYDNVNYMWTMDDAERIKQAAEESNKSVVIGGGLLGIDLAMAYAENNSETYYIIKDNTWWHRGLDEEGAEIVHRKLEEKGVNVVTDTRIKGFETEDNRVIKAVADSGDEFECDSVSVAIGQTPNSEFIDVEKNSRGMIQTDEYLQTSDDSIYAAGNMVEYYSPVFKERTVKGSWDHSEAMGETAGENMSGEKKIFDYVNTYGVGHFDAQFLAIGDWTGEAVSRKYDENHYRRLFFEDNRLIGAVLIGYTTGQERIREMIKHKEQVEDREELLDKSYWE